MTQQEFQQISHTIPLTPGIYKYYDSKNELLYVGKAKSLRKRVGSYFNKTFTTYKTHELVQRIRRIEFTIVNSEQDAFLLENSLIKQFQPKFNINLKDDKTYPYIVIKNEPFPRIFLTRRKISDGSEYLGPFTSVGKVRELMDFVKATIQLRTCKLNLTDNNISKGKFKVCLEYHLGNCKGPCEGHQSADDYKEGLQQIRNILKGNLNPVIQRFKMEMRDEAANMRFERAEIIRKKISHMEQYAARSVVVGSSLRNADVFSLLREEDKAYVNYLMVQNGTIVQTHTSQLETHLEEPDEEVLAFAIAQLRETFNSNAKEIIVQYTVEYPDPEVIVTVPRGGDKKKLLDLSEKNVNYFREELRKKRMLQLEGKDDMEKKKVLYQLQDDLKLQEVPVHIECFDNSNFQGSYPVSAMVCFRMGIPSKDDYRHYNVKTVQGINDFATMKEVVYRRYKRLTDENQPLPQLVIIDGGKGQLSAAMESIMSLGIEGKMTVVGLAKNEEEIFYPGDQESLKLPYNSASLHLIRRIRDEVHRFGIRFHRQKRSQGTFKNELEQIKGIGKNTADQLLKEFRSVKRIKELGKDELFKAVGNAKGKLIWAFFHRDAPAAELAPDSSALPYSGTAHVVSDTADIKTMDSIPMPGDKSDDAPDDKSVAFGDTSGHMSSSAAFAGEITQTGSGAFNNADEMQGASDDGSLQTVTPGDIITNEALVTIYGDAAEPLLTYEEDEYTDDPDEIMGDDDQTIDDDEMIDDDQTIDDDETVGNQDAMDDGETIDESEDLSEPQDDFNGEDLPESEEGSNGEKLNKNKE